LLKIDYEFGEDYYDTANNLATSEFDGGTKAKANAPKDNFYFNNNPFQLLGNKIAEQGNLTLESTNRIAEEFMIKDIRESNPKRSLLNGWTNSSKRNTLKQNVNKVKKNMSYTSSGNFNRIKIDLDTKTIITKSSNIIKETHKSNSREKHNHTKSHKQYGNLAKRSVRTSKLNVSQKIKVNYSNIKFTTLTNKSRETNRNKQMVVSRESSQKTLNTILINKRKAKYLENKSTSQKLNLSATSTNIGPKKTSNYERFKNALTTGSSPLRKNRVDVKNKKNMSILNSGMGSMRNRNYINFSENLSLQKSTVHSSKGLRKKKNHQQNLSMTNSIFGLKNLKY
jgi:hypothetical protein